MFQLLGFLGNVVMEVVNSQNKREVEICKSNNSTRVAMALSAYYGFKSNNSTDNNSGQLLLKSGSYEPTNLSNEEEKSYIE